MRQLITLSLLVLALGLWACPSSSPENASSSETASEAAISTENVESETSPAAASTEGKELIKKMDFESGTTEEADAVQGEATPKAEVQPEDNDDNDDNDDDN